MTGGEIEPRIEEDREGNDLGFASQLPLWIRKKVVAQHLIGKYNYQYIYIEYF